MKLNMYAIYDKVAEIFNKPFTEINDASAVRAFKQSLDDNKAVKEDYELYNVGVFTDHDGVIIQEKTKRIYSGIEYKIDDLPEIKTQAS